MSTHFFHSGMTGAPTNTNAAGSTLEIIRSCLVTGFNVQPVTGGATVTSGVMTLNYGAPHGYEDKVLILLEGEAYNAPIVRRATVTGPQVLTIPASEYVDGPVDGTLSTKVAPADWEEVFTDTNVGVFRSKVIGPGSTRFFYRVADMWSGAGSARLRGYESMTSAHDGVSAFPTSGDLNGLPMLRENASAAGHWVVIADGRTVYLAFGRGTPDTYCSHFGDESAFSSTDLFCASIGAGSAGQLSKASATCDRPRPASGVGLSQSAPKIAPLGDSGARARSYPSPIDGGMTLMRPIMGLDGSSSSSAIRSSFRGLMHCSARPMSGPWTIIQSVIGVTGRVLVVGDAGTDDCVAFPIDEDWA